MSAVKKICRPDMNKVHTPGIQVLRQSNGMVQHEYEPGQYEIIPMDAPWRFEQQLR